MVSPKPRKRHVVVAMTRARRYVAALLGCLLCGMLQFTALAQGDPAAMRAAEVSGTVRGHFLTPDGRLTQRTLKLASGSTERATERLRLLRCRYRLTATLTAPRAITSIRVETPDGATVWRLEPVAPEPTVWQRRDVADEDGE